MIGHRVMSRGYRSIATVSRNMSAIKRSGSRIERTLAAAMWKSGLRYRKQYPIVGRPDFAFPHAKVALFCDSEFWHGYGWGESRKAEFRKNSSFWISKIERNMQRDCEVNELLRTQGWVVLRFWGNEIAHETEKCVRRVRVALAIGAEEKTV